MFIAPQSDKEGFLYTYGKRKGRKPYVLGIGCSNSNPEYIPRVSEQHDSDNYEFPRWTEKFASRISKGWEVRARNGVSNEEIFNVAVNYLAEDSKNIHILIVGWTEFVRFSIWGENKNLYKTISRHLTDHPPKETETALYKNQILKMQDGFDDGIRNCIETNLFYIYTLQELCKSMNVKFLFFNAVNEHFGYSSYKEMCELWDLKPCGFEKIIDFFSKSPYGYKIYPRTFIDFPKLGVVSPNDTTQMFREHRFNIDSHLNEYGHDKWANALHERYLKIYGGEE
jgi:hypothetical protein